MGSNNNLKKFSYQLNNMEKIFTALRYLKHLLFSGFYHLGWPVVFRKDVQINNAGKIYLGKNISLDQDCELNVIDNYQNFRYNYSKPIIKIEENVGISKGTLISAVRSIHIKKNAMIGQFCFIGDYDHSYKDIDKPIVVQPLININPVVIKEGTWIGAHVTIVSGVTIGRNTVIGANSVVTKDIPDYSIAVGVPAKVIKKFNFKTRNWDKVI